MKWVLCRKCVGPNLSRLIFTGNPFSYAISTSTFVLLGEWQTELMLFGEPKTCTCIIYSNFVHLGLIQKHFVVFRPNKSNCNVVVSGSVYYY